jgi:hypothetical protein
MIGCPQEDDFVHMNGAIYPDLNKGFPTIHTGVDALWVTARGANPAELARWTWRRLDGFSPLSTTPTTYDDDFYLHS